MHFNPALNQNDNTGSNLHSSQQHNFIESERRTYELFDKYANLSNMNTPKEYSASNIEPDSNFILQQNDPLDVWASSCPIAVPQHVSDNRAIETENYSSSCIYGRGSFDNQTDALQSNRPYYNKACMFTSHEPNEVSSFMSDAVYSNEEYRVENEANNAAFSGDYICAPETYDSSENGRFLLHKNISETWGNDGNREISIGQWDDMLEDILESYEKTQNRTTSTHKANENKRKSEDFYGNTNEECTVAGVSRPNDQPPQNDRHITCIECGKSFFQKDELIHHQRTHLREKSHICEICGKCFSSLRYLSDHRKIHTDVKSHVCEYCGKRFIWSSKLSRHRRTHTGEKPYVCEYCGKGFNQSGNLAQHRRTHTGEKTHVCEICGKRFILKGNLTRHRRTHTGETPYECSVCGLTFTRSNNLNYHYKNVHKLK